jgi:putative Holliday junction resolvase
MEEGRLLAIDYGQRSIGLAVSDAGRSMAFGRGVLKNLPGEVGQNQVILQIINLCKTDDVKRILMGLPLGPNQEETPQTARIREFAGLLEKMLKIADLDLPIEFVDESFSSYEANKILSGLGVRGQDRKRTEDEMAAIVLIHRYIDFRP